MGKSQYGIIDKCEHQHIHVCSLVSLGSGLHSLDSSYFNLQTVYYMCTEKCFGFELTYLF